MRGQMKSQLFVMGLVVLALATPCWSLALTTFGKPGSQQLPGEQVQARECETDTDCASINSTLCLENIFGRGDQRRCLCGDYRRPINGRCENDKKRVKVQCSSDEECIEGAQCTVDNTTTIDGKWCWCMQGYHVDEDRDCVAMEEKKGPPRTHSFIDTDAVVRGLLRVLESLGRTESGRPASVILTINNN